MRQVKQQRPSEKLEQLWAFRAPGIFFSASSEYLCETLEFVAMRRAKDADTLRRMQTCQSWQELVREQGKWANELLTDYTREPTKVIEIAQKQVEMNTANSNTRLAA
jgi:hypothetical protein